MTQGETEAVHETELDSGKQDTNWPRASLSSQLPCGTHICPQPSAQPQGPTPQWPGRQVGVRGVLPVAGGTIQVGPWESRQKHTSWVLGGEPLTSLCPALWGLVTLVWTALSLQSSCRGGGRAPREAPCLLASLLLEFK